MIIYETTVKVKLRGKHIGTIKEIPKPDAVKRQYFPDAVKYQYFPKGSKTGGEIFDSIDDVKATL